MCILLHINSSDCAISCLSGFHYYPLDLITSVVKPLVALFLSSVTKKESHTILASLFKHVFSLKLLKLYVVLTKQKSTTLCSKVVSSKVIITLCYTFTTEAHSLLNRKPKTIEII